MLFLKITYGYVVQCYNDAGEFLAQSFVAGDSVDYEISETSGEGGLPINQGDMPLGGDEYFPFNMVQE